MPSECPLSTLLSASLIRYNNRISSISGLEGVPSLRVLMLGKNAIRAIERLEKLTKLDVLDLHCNQVRGSPLIAPGELLIALDDH